MEDTASPATIPADAPGATGSGVQAGATVTGDRTEPGYRIARLRSGPDGRVEAEVVNWLSPRVYTPTVATKFMATVAQGYVRGEAVFVPTYRSIAVLGSGSGRPPGPAIRVRARRLVAKAFTESRRSARSARAATTKPRGSRPRMAAPKSRRSRPRK